MSFVSAAGIPQALQTGYASRLRLEQTSLFMTVQPIGRNHTRSSSAPNYVDYDYSSSEESDPTFGQASENELTPHPSEHGGRRTEIKRLALPTKHANYTPSQLQQLSVEEECLIPIRLNLDVEHFKVTDFFLWNVNEPSLTPEQFAIITCQDLDLPVGYTSTISNAIKAQITEYATLSTVKLAPDMRVVIDLSMNIAMDLYEDKFEWDLGTSELSVVGFAQTVTADMGLSTEFMPAIAHALQEAILRAKRDILEGRPPHDKNQVLPGQESGLRYDPEELGESWTPKVLTLTQGEIERREMERERMIRRMKRESARMSEIEVGGMFGRSKRRRGTDAW